MSEISKRKEPKRKFALWVKESSLELVRKLYKDDNCSSQSEFIEKAILFYAGYLSAQENKSYLPNVVTSTLKSIVAESDKRQKTCYYYQESVLLYTTDSNGNKTSQNIIGPQENIIATIRYEEDGQATYFYNKDIRTSVTNVVNDVGQGVVSYRYDDYGTTTKYGDTDFYNDICYTSGVYDELTSLYYLNARYYNPETYTFITQDSYRGEKNDYGTWNMYAYCAGNPIAYVDPSGHIIQEKKR